MIALSGAALAGCASAPVAAPPVTAVPVAPPSLDTKVAWILRLEQQRVLRDADATAADAPATPAAPPASGFRPAMAPDLAQLLTDTDPVVRARAALAIGRVGIADGAASLVTALQDPEESVRGSAAFALGLLASRESVGALRIALADPSVAVRGRVVEALGLIGDGATAADVWQAASGCAPLLAPIEPDDEQWPKSPEIELCRLALYALVRLQNYDALAAVALDAQGRPVSSWWPVAYALQRSGDRRAIVALRTLATVPGVYTAGFALRGLAALEDRETLPLARTLTANREADVKLRVAAVRLLARVGGPEDVAGLAAVLAQEPWESPLGLEVVATLGAIGGGEALDILLDGLSHPEATVRAATMAAAARVDPEAFVLVLSGLGRDRDWRVRAALATTLGTLPDERVTPAIVELSEDEDARVRSPALRALAAVRAPDLPTRLEAALEADDFAERTTAATIVGETRPEGGVAWLVAAYERAQADAAYDARLAAIDALAKYGGDQAIDTIRLALGDAEWPVRLRAGALLTEMKVPDAEPERPAPLRHAPAFFHSDALLRPPYTPRAFIETTRGIIEIELDLVHAPLTAAAFVEQVRSGLFNGLRVHRLVPAFVIQDGDPRGDGEGGPGYTQRDELNRVPYLRGTVGMALAGPETAGSQWFITTTPQPHLDAKYTVFARVVNGWDVLDRVAAGDAIDRIRIWDGVELR